MALFVNSGDEHVTIPDGRGGALIVPAGCEVVEGPDGALVALPRGAPRIGDSVWRSADAALLDQMVADTFVPTDEPGPFADPDPAADEPAVDLPAFVEPGEVDLEPLPTADEPTTAKRRRGGTAA